MKNRIVRRAKSFFMIAIFLAAGAVLFSSCSWITETAKNAGGKSENGKKTEENGKTPGDKNALNERWNLVSVKITPETAPQGWDSYNAQSTSVHMTVYNGNVSDFKWTAPPQQIDSNGFTMKLNVEQQAIPNNVMASGISVWGTGITPDTPGQHSASATSEPGMSARAEHSVTFKPNPKTDDLDVRIGMNWEAVTFIYKYRRVQ